MKRNDRARNWETSDLNFVGAKVYRMCDVEDRLTPSDSRLEICRVEDVGLEEYEIGVSTGKGPEEVHLGPVICESGLKEAQEHAYS